MQIVSFATWSPLQVWLAQGCNSNPEFLSPSNAPALAPAPWPARAPVTYNSATSMFHSKTLGPSRHPYIVISFTLKVTDQ